MRLISIFLLLTACEKKEVITQPIRPVVVKTVAVVDSEPPIYFTGYSKAFKEIDISFRVAGNIEVFPIKVGDCLTKGQLIAELDKTNYELELEKTQARIEHADADLRKASSRYRRIKALYETDSASLDELESARAAYEEAKADVTRATSAKELAWQNIEHTTLIAEKESCKVKEKLAEVYENVEAGQVIAKLDYGQQMEVEIAVSENDISRIFQGEEAEVFFSSLPNKAYKGYVREIGASSTKGTVFPVTILLHTHHPELRSGMAAKVVLHSRKPLEKPILTVPLTAVSEDTSGAFVYVVDENDIVHKRTVTVGEISVSGLIITSGLRSGEKVVIAGLRYMREGKKVKVMEGNLPT